MTPEEKAAAARRMRATRDRRRRGVVALTVDLDLDLVTDTLAELQLFGSLSVDLATDKQLRRPLSHFVSTALRCAVKKSCCFCCAATPDLSAEC